MVKLSSAEKDLYFKGTCNFYINRFRFISKIKIDNVEKTSFKKIDSFFVQEVLKNDFLNQLFSISVQVNNSKSIFIGTRKMQKNAKKRKPPKPIKIINFAGVDTHYFLSVLYNMTTSEDKELFNSTFYDSNDIVIENMNLLVKLFNNELNLFLQNYSEFITEAIYSINNEQFYTKQLLFNLDQLNMIKHTYKFENYYEQINNNAKILFFGERIKNLKERYYSILRRDWFDDSRECLLEEWNRYKYEREV